MAVTFSSSLSLFLSFRASQKSIEELPRLHSIVTSPYSFAVSIQDVPILPSILILHLWVPVNIEIETSDPSDVAEKVKLKAQELRDQSRIKKENEEKKLEREREKERRRSGKELLDAKSIQEENERQRFIVMRKAEKEQEKKDRDKILQKLQQDKAERRWMLRLPVEDPPSTKITSNLMQREKGSLPVKLGKVTGTAKTKELMMDCLRSLKRNHKDNDTKVRRAFQTLLVYVRNVVKNPEEEKIRKVRISNPAFQERLGNMKEGTEFLELCGFERVEGGKFLFLPRDKVDLEVLKSAGTALDTAITNPFFGLLSK